MTFYPARMANLDGTSRLIGTIEFTSSTNQPTGTSNPVTSGTLPDLGSWVSTTAKVNPVTRPITVVVEVVSDGTNNAGTCAIAISPDDSTYTTVGTVAVPAAVNNLGVVKEVVPVNLPNGWYIKLTFTATRITVAASNYY